MRRCRFWMLLRGKAWTICAAIFLLKNKQGNTSTILTTAHFLSRSLWVTALKGLEPLVNLPSYADQRKLNRPWEQIVGILCYRYASDMKKFLHVGCGSRKKDKTTSGFNSEKWQEVRFDIDKSYSSDIVGDMTDMSEIKDSSMDAVFSHHSIEHLYYHQVLLAIKEFFRVLKSDGFLFIVFPDLRSICELVVQERLSEEMFESSIGKIAPIDMIYGHRLSIKNGATSMAHCSGFTRTTLVDILRSAGFKSFVAVARLYPCLDIWAFASKSLLNREELRSLASEHYPGKATNLPWQQMTGLAN